MLQGLQVIYSRGLDEKHRKAASLLYDHAFGHKFATAIKSRQDRITLFENAFVSDFAITANIENKLVGIAGLHTAEGSLTRGINVNSLLSRLGVIKGLRAIAVFSFYERKLKPG